MFGLPKAEHFKSHHLKSLTKNDHPSAIADHITATGHNIKWDHFDILASGNTDYHCKIKETMFKRRGVCDPGGGGRGTPIHYLYVYVPPKGVVILRLLI